MWITGRTAAFGCYPVHMEGQVPQMAPPATHDVAAALNPATATPASSDASDASASPVAALANELEYTLTVDQARQLFSHHHRKVPAERTLQNYCIEGTIAAQKIRTTYGAEWLINERSLLAVIERQPQLTTATAAPPATHDVAAALNPATATPASSDASDASASVPVGERRTIADVLIENAKLLAQVEGREQMITELKDDRSFLREEVREARKTRDDVKSIANRMLETLETMALGGKLLRSSSQEPPIRVDHDAG